MIRGAIFSIQRFCLHDGAGIRTTVFLKGCPLQCLWCHNPESQAVSPERGYRADRCLRCERCVVACAQGALAMTAAGIEVDRSRCVGEGECAAVCPSGATELIGRSWTVPEVMAVLRRDVPFYDESGGGVTFSGGEPLYQPEFLEALLLACREEGMRAGLDTSGYASGAVVERLAPLCEEVLYDVKHASCERHVAWTGVGNELILDNLARVRRITRERDTTLRVRVPLIAGFNDDGAAAAALAKVLLALTPPPPVDLLPYQPFGTSKYERLGRGVAAGLAAPPQVRQAECAAQLRDAGLQVTIRGEPHESV